MDEPAPPQATPDNSAKEIARLSRRIQRLEETLSGVESIRDSNRKLLDRLMTDLDVERQRSHDLLLNVLPEAIVARLDAGETLIADAHPHVVVVFSDLVGFTQIAATLAPRDLVAELNELLQAFDAAATRHGVEKIKTMGDAYLAVAGLTEQEDDPIEAAVSLALEMRDAVMAATDRWHIRIGVHAGPVVAGVIGTRKFAYDVWGDTVNVASRLESTAPTDAIQVSDEVASALPARFRIEARGQTRLKGKGETHTWLVLGATEDGAESPRL
jgi:class 3 adenylate cyclase